MGSFNSSCFLSNQNIYVNDQIVCLILINNPHPPKNYFNYISDLYLNLFLPITGYYDDYGIIEPPSAEEKKLNLFFDAIENKKYSFEDFQELCWDKKAFLSNSGRLVVDPKENEKEQLSLSAISLTYAHYDNYLSMIKNIKEDKDSIYHFYLNDWDKKRQELTNQSLQLGDLLFPFKGNWQELSNSSMFQFLIYRWWQTIPQKVIGKKILQNIMSTDNQESEYFNNALTDLVAFHEACERSNIILRPMKTSGQEYINNYQLRSEIEFNQLKRELAYFEKSNPDFKKILEVITKKQAQIDQLIIDKINPKSKKKNKNKI